MVPSMARTSPSTRDTKVSTRKINSVLSTGTPGCQANYLLDFLRYNDAETIYLIGDIIDFWAMKRRGVTPLVTLQKRSG